MYNQGEYIVDIILGFFVILSYTHAHKNMWVGVDEKKGLYYFYIFSIITCFIFGFCLFLEDIILKNDAADREILNGWHVLLSSAMLWISTTYIGLNYKKLNTLFRKLLPLIPLIGTVVGACMLLAEYIKNQEWWKVAFGSYHVAHTFFLDLLVWYSFYLRQFTILSKHK